MGAKTQSRAEHRELPGSRFVTGIAKLFIALSGLGLLLGLFQMTMLFTALGVPEGWVVQSVSNDTAARALALGVVLLCALTLALAFALLQRKPWARGAFVVLMGFGAAWHLVTLLALLWFRPEAPLKPPARAGPPEGGGLARMQNRGLSAPHARQSAGSGHAQDRRAHALHPVPPRLRAGVTAGRQRRCTGCRDRL